MKNIVLIISVVFIIVVNHAQADDKKFTPLEISKIVFGNDGFDYSKVLPFCCEMHELNFREYSLGQMLPSQTLRNYQLLYQGDSIAVVAVSMNLNNENQDIYVFFSKLEDWHIETIRTFVKTEVIKTAISEVDMLDNDSASKIIAKYGYDDVGNYIKRNKLLISSDKNIENYFIENEATFQEIISYIETQYPQISSERIRQLNKDEFISNKLNLLLIDKIVPTEGSEFIGFQIGGIMDNSAGFFYQNDPNKVPKMSKDLYIMIKPLGNGWYLYKTT